MKRLLILTAGTFSLLLLGALPAAAEYPPTGNPNPPLVLPDTLDAPTTAFTGSSAVPLLIAAIALFAVGWLLVLVARRLRNAPIG